MVFQLKINELLASQTFVRYEETYMEPGYDNCVNNMPVDINDILASDQFCVFLHDTYIRWGIKNVLDLNLDTVDVEQAFADFKCIQQFWRTASPSTFSDETWGIVLCNLQIIALDVEKIVCTNLRDVEGVTSTVDFDPSFFNVCSAMPPPSGA